MRSTRKGTRRVSQRFAFESLERREMLSAVPPTVVNVEVASSQWSTEFRDYLQANSLGTHGYSIPVGSAAQAAALTWTNLDQIMITFSEDVHVFASSLSVSGVNTTAYGFSDFNYNPQTRVAVWTLDTPFNNDRLQLDLDGDGAGAVRDLDDNLLDGEWADNSSTYQSGNGTAGGDFEFSINTLPTDVNNSTNVTFVDYQQVRLLSGKSTTSQGYVAAYDIDGSGLIDNTDWMIALAMNGQTLPTGDPAGATNDAPTTSGLNLVTVDLNATDEAVSLLYAFDDDEDGSSGLTYSIVGNSDPALLDGTYVDSETGELVINTGSGLTGRATITIRATDSGGLFVDTTQTIDVNRFNEPPVLISLITESHEFNTDWWTIRGQIADPDDLVENMFVYITGALNVRLLVSIEGHFRIDVVLGPGEWGGIINCYCLDPHGSQSNIEVEQYGGY